MDKKMAPSGVAANISATRLLKGSSSAFQGLSGQDTTLDFRMPDFPHPVMLLSAFNSFYDIHHNLFKETSENSLP